MIFLKPQVSILVLAATTLLCSNVQAENLFDIYQLALANDATYQAAAANYEASRFALPLAHSEFRPDVSSSGTLGKRNSDFSGSSIASDNNDLSVSIDMRLFDRARQIGVNQAELNVEAALLQFAIAKNELTLRVADRYFNILAARDSKEVARLQKIAIKRQMDLATERLDVGLGTRTDLFDARARFEQANADLIAADIAINNARQALVEIIGTTPESVADISQDSELRLPEPNNLQSWTNLARKNNLQVRARNLDLLIASSEVDRQRAGRSPTVSVGASQRWQDNSSGNGVAGGESNSTSIGLNVNLPIYVGGSIALRTQQARLRFNASEQQLEATRRQVVTSATSSFLAVTSGISQVEALEEAIRAGESALEAKEEGFSAGLTTNLDVLDAQRDLSRSRTDYLRAKYNYFLAILQLEDATGGLDTDDILYINQWITEDRANARSRKFFKFDQDIPQPLVSRKFQDPLSFKMAGFRLDIN